MTNSNNTLITLITQLENWVTLADLSNQQPQFTFSQLKRLFWKRGEDPCLESCCKLVGKRLYINAPMFGLWMAGELPSVQPIGSKNDD